MRKHRHRPNNEPNDNVIEGVIIRRTSDVLISDMDYNNNPPVPGRTSTLISSFTNEGYEVPHVYEEPIEDDLITGLYDNDTLPREPTPPPVYDLAADNLQFNPMYDKAA